MWNARTRESLWKTLPITRWDLLVIGGGIIGAAVLREASRAGLRVLLVEQRDFASGTSSRSTKLIQGGLRYLDTFELRLVREAVRERERLVAEGGGLVKPLPFFFSFRPSEGLRRWKPRAAVAVYDMLTGHIPRNARSAREVKDAAPGIRDEPGLRGLPYDEASVDDARLVIRVIQEAGRSGAAALNYVRAASLIQREGSVVGAELFDTLTKRSCAIEARAVVNATGAWANLLRRQVNGASRVRPLRGSHLLFSSSRFPLSQGISFRHPSDRRYVCALPWENTTLVGTTDLDHEGSLDTQPHITLAEANYLLEAARHEFPSLALTVDDVVSTFAGVRPVISTDERDPSKASREHLVLEDEGLVSVTGGKLTTCRAIARDALRALEPRIPELNRLEAEAPFLEPVPTLQHPRLDAAASARLSGRYGRTAQEVATAAQDGELSAVSDTSTLWAELRWGARCEGVAHLDDLLLRRVRLGLLIRRGAEELLPRVRELCQPELGWDNARWEQEATEYLALWKRCHAVPDS